MSNNERESIIANYQTSIRQHALVAAAHRREGRIEQAMREDFEIEKIYQSAKSWCGQLGDDIEDVLFEIETDARNE